MNTMNKVILFGYLGSDPRLLVSREGKSYATLSLATNRNWKDKDGENKERTDWHRVNVWGAQGALCQTRLRKGSPVCIEGYISSYEIDDDDGKKKRITTITALDVKFVSNGLQ